MRRHTILEALCASKGEYISGEHLSRTLGITRSAVWKGVDALRREGYEIESRTRLGYRLLSMPDTLEPEALAARLNTAVVGRRILFFDTLDSTNTYAKQAALAGGENMMSPSIYGTEGKIEKGKFNDEHLFDNPINSYSFRSIHLDMTVLKHLLIDKMPQ